MYYHTMYKYMVRHEYVIDVVVIHYKMSWSTHAIIMPYNM